jgi:ABC-type Mn2+/Zn2+ transport system ATPase subunit
MSRIDVQQNKVVATAVKAVGRQMHLLRRRQMDEASAGQRLRPKLALGLSS